ASYFSLSLALPPPPPRSPLFPTRRSSDLPSPEGGEMLPDLFGQHGEKGHDLFGSSGELGPQVLPLGRDADRAGVEMALAHHLAAEGEQWECSEPESLGSQERRNDDVATGPQATVGLEGDR